MYFHIEKALSIVISDKTSNFHSSALINRQISIMCCSYQVHCKTLLILCLSLTLCLLTVSVEFGRAVWLRFYPPAFPPCPNPSFVAHLGGVVVGLTLGVVVLQNYEQRLHEQSLFWIFFCVYTLFVLCAVFWNIFAYSLLDVRLPPPP